MLLKIQTKPFFIFCVFVCILFYFNLYHRHRQHIVKKVFVTKATSVYKSTVGNGIPAILHYSYLTCDVPAQLVPLIRNCMKINPDIKFMFWTDEQILKIVKERYAPFLYDVIKSALSGIERSDIMRNVLMHQFGGIYMDMDMECRRPLREALQNFTCILDKEPEVQSQIIHNIEFGIINNFMACQPKHSYFEFDLMSAKISNKTKLIAGWLNIMVANYYNSKDIIHQPLTIANSSWFSPLVDRPNLQTNINKYCNKKDASTKPWREVGCQHVKGYFDNMNRMLNESYLVHRFLHFGYRDPKKLQRKNICIQRGTSSISFFDIDPNI